MKKLKLIEIKKDIHYIIVDDSEKATNGHCALDGDFITKKLIDSAWTTDRKITHSTQPLEPSIKSDKHDNPKGFVLIKPLSLLEVEELIYGHSVEKMAEDAVGHLLNDEERKMGYIEGFNAHKELVKDMFSLKEIEAALKELSKPQYKFDTKTTFKDLLYMQRKTEWDVEFDENNKLKLLH
jgi:hypothetical protein